MGKREVKLLLERVNYVRISESSPLDEQSGWCDACGAFTPYRHEPVINDQLAEDWRLTERLRHDFSSRESRACVFCGCSYRLRMMARALRQVVAGSEALSLLESVAAGDFKGKKVAEINSCGKLHGVLQDIPGLRYSEYASEDPSIPHQDLLKLSYPDASFDIVLTSDTLEHVPDVDRALQEIYRVLKPGGIHVCTVPWILTRSTVVRTKLSASGQEYSLPASFHGSGEPDYLVWSEFGSDFIDSNERIGFSCDILYQHMPDWRSPTGVLLARKGSANDELLYIDSAATGEDVAALRAELQRYEIRRNVTVKTPVQTLALTDYRFRKIQDLAYKLSLTEDHANNQTARVAQLENELAGVRKQFIDYQEELERVRAALRSIPQARMRRAIIKLLKRLTRP